MALIKSILCLCFLVAVFLFPLFRQQVINAFNKAGESVERNRKSILLAVFAIYVVLILLLQFYHFVDGDEGQAWLIARDTDSLKQMYSAIGYEGSPALWHTIQRPFARAGAPFEVVYFLNFFFVISAVGIWLWFAPLPLLVRIILPFTHIFLTEYSVNARSYGLSILLLFTALTLYKRYNAKWLLWSLVFFLLANTNGHSALLCCGFVLFLLLNWVSQKNSNDLKALVLISAGILLAVIQILPPSDLDPDLAAIRFQQNPQEITQHIITGTTIISAVLFLALLALVSIATKNRFLVYSLLAMQAALLFLFLFKYLGQVRHHFFLFIAILMCLWIGELKERFKPIVHVVLFAILGIMAISGFQIAIEKLQPGNDHKKEITEYIQTVVKPDSTTFIACHPDNVAVAILPKINCKEFYMPDAVRLGSYIIWNQKRRSGLFNPDSLQNLTSLVRNKPGFTRYLYLTIEELPPDSLESSGIRLLKRATNEKMAKTDINWSSYYLYSLSD